MVVFSLSCWFWRGLLSWIPYDSFLYRGTFHSNTHKWSPSGPTKQIWTRKLLLKCTGTRGHLWCCHCTNDGHFTARSARSKTYRRPERWPLILLAAKSRREDLQQSKSRKKTEAKRKTKNFKNISWHWMMNSNFGIYPGTNSIIVKPKLQFLGCKDWLFHIKQFWTCLPPRFKLVKVSTWMPTGLHHRWCETSRPCGFVFLGKLQLISISSSNGFEERLDVNCEIHFHECWNLQESINMMHWQMDKTHTEKYRYT